MTLKTLSNSAFTYVHKSSKGKKPYKSWLKDGVNGGPCSMQVLISWLSNKHNYKRWKREDYPIDRVPKKDLLEEIIDKLRQVGIYHRLSKDVASKISTLQSNYRQTRRWRDTEGHKLANKQLLHDELLKRFPYWDVLDPVFGCSSSAMDIDTIVSRQSSIDSNSSSSNNNEDTTDDLHQYICSGRRKELQRMQKSQEMLLWLRQRKHKETSQQRLLLQHEKLQVEREFINCLYKAGFTPTEARYYI